MTWKELNENKNTHVIWDREKYLTANHKIIHKHSTFQRHSFIDLFMYTLKGLRRGTVVIL